MPVTRLRPEATHPCRNTCLHRRRARTTPIRAEAHRNPQHDTRPSARHSPPGAGRPITPKLPLIAVLPALILLTIYMISGGCSAFFVLRKQLRQNCGIVALPLVVRQLWSLSYSPCSNSLRHGPTNPRLRSRPRPFLGPPRAVASTEASAVANVPPCRRSQPRHLLFVAGSALLPRVQIPSCNRTRATSSDSKRCRPAARRPERPQATVSNAPQGRCGAFRKTPAPHHN